MLGRTERDPAFLGVALRDITLMSSEDLKNNKKKTPIGRAHANDGIMTVDGFQWALKISQFFMVYMSPGIPIAEIMSWSRLAKALAFVDRAVPAVQDGYGEDDVNYNGPATPPPDPVYELTWKDIRAQYGQHSSFSEIPQLAHPLRLPEVITTHTEPVMFGEHHGYIPPRGTLSHHKTSRVYHRVYPPPQLLFEDERLHADVFYSRRGSEKVGWGHSSEVYRVRMEHPDLSCQLPEIDEVDPETLSTEDEADSMKSADFEPHSPAFYAALLTAKIHDYRRSNTSLMTFHLEVNVDPFCSDNAYERSTRDEGKWGIPWSAIQAMWKVLRRQEKRRDEKGKDAVVVGIGADAGADKEISREEQDKPRGQAKSEMGTEIGQDGASDKGTARDQSGNGKAAEAEEQTKLDKSEEGHPTQEKMNRTTLESAYGPVFRFYPTTFERTIQEGQEREICEPDGTIRKESIHYIGDGEPCEYEAYIIVKDEYGGVRYGYVVRQRYTPREEIVERIMVDNGEVLNSDIKESATYQLRKEKGLVDEVKEDALGSESVGKSMFLGESRRPLYGRHETWFNDSDTKPPTIREREFRVQRIFDGIVYEFDQDSDTRVNLIISKPPSPAPPSEENKEEVDQKVRLPVTLLAKLPYCTSEARDFVTNEGMVYSRIYELYPWLMEGTKGFIHTKPIHQPMQATACVPRFYGMYRCVEHKEEPISTGGKRVMGFFKETKVSYMLLLEECGTPVVKKDLTSLEKTQIMSQLRRIHRAGIIQNSPSVRNILTQPGPLFLPPFYRSLDSPSFRIIDFGRGGYYPKLPQEERKGLKRCSEFYQACMWEENTLAESVAFGKWNDYPDSMTDGVPICAEDGSVLEEWP